MSKGKKAQIKQESPYFWLLFLLLSVICFGGFTYVFSTLSTPAGIEIISN